MKLINMTIDKAIEIISLIKSALLIQYSYNDCNICFIDIYIIPKEKIMIIVTKINYL